MRCNRCRHELVDGARYCTECGQPVAPGRTVAPAMNFRNHGFLISLGVFVLLIGGALAAVFYLRTPGKDSSNVQMASGNAMSAGLSAGGTAQKPAPAAPDKIAEPPKSDTATPAQPAPPADGDMAADESAPDDADAVPDRGIASSNESASDDDYVPARRGHRGGGGPIEILGTFSQGSGRRAATVYVVGCNGERFHIYEFLNRPGFRAVDASRRGGPIGGGDFETYEDAVRAACE